MPIAERQIGKGQDYAACGEIENMKYAFVADGHGSSKCIDFLRSIDPHIIATESNPCQYLFEMVQTIGDTFHSGFTFTFARVVQTEESQHIQVWNVGDSETHVHVNGALLYKTTPHNFLCDVEVARTKPLVNFVEPTKAPFPVSATRIENVLSPVGNFKCGENLALSMSYGHNNMTGFDPAMWEGEVANTDLLHIVCGSDGFFDMLVPDLFRGATELADEAAARWQQRWEYFDGRAVFFTKYEGGFDDVAVAVI